MENILRIIYDKTLNNRILDLNDIEKILESLVMYKCLNDYILNINVQYIRSNNLASYSPHTKKITLYITVVEQMIKDIETNILNANDFEIMLYKNLSILQVLLHEVEHANQQKIVYDENSLEALIIKLSHLVIDNGNEKLYEFCPEERLAEIKSYDEIIELIKYLNKELLILPEILNTEKLRRLLRGYHYSNSSITVPIIDYFTFGKKSEVLKVFDLSTDVKKKYTLNERLKYGFPISIHEYGYSMKKLVLSLDKNFKNKINIIKG